MISKTSLQAIRALVILAELPPGEHQGAAAIAQRIGAPSNYLGKMLQSLTRFRLVESQKGLHGGFRLAKPAAEISLIDVMNCIEDLDKWNECVLGRPECSEIHPCVVHHKWKIARNACLDLLRSTTLEAVVKSGELDGEPV